MISKVVRKKTWKRKQKKPRLEAGKDNKMPTRKDGRNNGKKTEKNKK